MKHSGKIDRTFRYRNAVSTNIRETFRRVRRKLRIEATKIVPIKKGAK